MKYKGLMTQKKTAIVFDLDGTLVDSMGDFTSLAAKIMNKHFDVSIDQATQWYLETSGKPFYYQLEHLFTDKVKIELAAIEFEEQTLEGYAEKDFFAEVGSVLQQLKSNGCLLFVSSNNHMENVVQKVKPLEHLFSLVLGYEEGFLKGHQHFERIQNEYGVGKENIVFVGDSLNDAKIAFENKIDFVAKLGTFSKSDFEALKLPVQFIDGVSDLVSVIGKFE